jgi:hypothetical protein
LSSLLGVNTFTVENLNKGSLKLGDQIIQLPKEKLLMDIIADSDQINKFRIYSSDQIWLLYFTYRAFVTSVMLVVN